MKMLLHFSRMSAIVPIVSGYAGNLCFHAPDAWELGYHGIPYRSGGLDGKAHARLVFHLDIAEAIDP